MKRTLLKIFGISFLSYLLIPLRYTFANNLIGFNTKLKKDESHYNIINSELTDEQKKIMFEKATERAGTSELNKEKRKGTYHCANCGAKLFTSSAKFDSRTGWPSFTDALPGAFKTKIDYSFGMIRTEYHCAKCGAHHGHVFNDGPDGKKRYCNNGLCLIFIPTN
tara:strand:+ start:386 stop:880 length:495 start_codon:yes stop_codon:yes gene_type:complete